jgi:hypothetical protein
MLPIHQVRKGKTGATKLPIEPGANRLLVPIEPLGNLGTALAIHRPQDAVLALPPPRLVGAAKGGPHVRASASCS